VHAREIAMAPPVYNDWTSVERLLPRIDDALTSIPCRARVLLAR